MFGIKILDNAYVFFSENCVYFEIDNIRVDFCHVYSTSDRAEIVRDFIEKFLEVYFQKYPECPDKIRRVNLLRDKQAIKFWVKSQPKISTPKQNPVILVDNQVRSNFETWLDYFIFKFPSMPVFEQASLAIQMSQQESQVVSKAHLNHVSN